MYEAYLWEGYRYSGTEEDVSTRQRRIMYETERLKDDYEDRLFEDPLYLMQYTLTWEDTNISGALLSPENDAFITTENEIYLRKVRSSSCISLYICTICVLLLKHSAHFQ